MASYQKYVAEGIGTMFLVLLACGSAVLAGPSGYLFYCVLRLYHMRYSAV